MKVAIVYDRVNKWGGAERVLLALHELFPDAPLYTSLYNSQKASWAKVFPEVRTSFLQKISFLRDKHEFVAALMPLAFEPLDFSEFDLVISVTSESAKGIITKPSTKHICYCLTPTRYLWSGYDTYFSNPFLKTFAYPAISYLKTWDSIAAKRPDAYVAISQTVRERIKKYYDRESIVIYPPVELAFSSVASSAQLRKKQLNANYLDAKRSSYFLIVSRLVSYKRIDIAIAACNALQLPLKIIGIGHEEEKLRKIAGPTIEFLGNLTDTELLEYYRNCRALLFPGEEDFGLVIVEAQRFGKPVIAFKAGGAIETII